MLGDNFYGQLGVGGIISRTTPTAVTVAVLGNAGDGTPKTVKSVAVGFDHTCAILNDDTVKCWGHNSSGQIGGGSGTDNTTSGTPGDPLSGTASRIATGTYHTCAVLSDKSVQCWGNNELGQTGGGTPSLGSGKTATDLAAGQSASCAILDDGSVVCWGNVGSPTLGSKTATKITAGYMHACALLNDKTVKCWGGNGKGQTGGGTAGSNRVLRGSLERPLGRTNRYSNCGRLRTHLCRYGVGQFR